MQQLTTLLRSAAVAAGVAYIALYVVLAGLRLRYPFELEWVEGGFVEHVRRLLDGQRLYVAPSLDFVPFIYPPLYFYAGALVSWVAGIGLVPLRLISIAASLGCLWLIFRFVTDETTDSAAGVLSAGVFAATFRISGAWFDLARVDSLFLFLLLAGLYLIRSSTSLRSHIAAGVCISLAFLTKQSALVMALPVGVYVLWRDWRRGLCFGATVLLVSGGSVLWLNILHDGWFWYYVFELPSEHKLLPENWVGFWTNDLLRPLWPACFVGVLTLIRPKRLPRGATFFYALFTLGLLGGAWMTRLHSGAFDNVLIPAYAALAVLVGLGAHTRAGQVGPNVAQRLWAASIYALCCLQFGLLIYNPRQQVPTAADEQAGREVVAALAQIKGPVFVPSHGYLAVLAGGRSYAHQAAIWDLFRGHVNATRTHLRNEIIDALQRKAFAALVMDGPTLMPTYVERAYVPARRLFGERDVFWTVTGLRTRPETIYVPRR